MNQLPTLNHCCRRDLLRYSLALAAGRIVVPSWAAEQDSSLAPLTTVKWDDGKKTHTQDGKILIEAQDGGVVLLSRDGQIWFVEGDQVKLKTTEEKVSFSSWDADRIGRQIQQELGFGFQTMKYDPLIIVTNTSQGYAKWCGDLFSRLAYGFQRYWKADRLPITDAKFPLPILIFASRKQFADYALSTADAATAQALGYYSIRTNRVAMYDITADEQGRPARDFNDVGRKMSKQISNVTTMVHEATHQFAFNYGLHTRFADNPLWLVEGMAMFFEVPDLNSVSGWASIGKPNKPRVAQFANWFKSGDRPQDSLKSLVRDDVRFTDAETAGLAYAEAWGLTYYLIQERRQDYTAFVKHISEKKILEYLEPEERLREFEKFFGNDWTKLDDQMLTVLKRIRR